MDRAAKRTTVLRLLPVFLALLVAFLGAPVAVDRPAGSVGSGISHSIGTHHTAADDASARTPEVEVLAPAAAGGVPDLVRALRAQVEAGATASRAPPFAA
ncbi:hypothetical protein AB0F81_01775 [Actinoplanes sp. NPDC024001]|uniref:hypothetical protein n=1 Tax=Actinoplanes sp. NPDC024001 TaxID=3154598 RepID=UPI0034117289